MIPFRIKRLAGELQMRRRRLTVYHGSQTWPGKDAAWRSELMRYDRLLVVAAEMLALTAPELPARRPLPRSSGPRSWTAWPWPGWTCSPRASARGTSSPTATSPSEPLPERWLPRTRTD